MSSNLVQLFYDCRVPVLWVLLSNPRANFAGLKFIVKWHSFILDCESRKEKEQAAQLARILNKRVFYRGKRSNLLAFFKIFSFPIEKSS